MWSRMWCFKRPDSRTAPIELTWQNSRVSRRRLLVSGGKAPSTPTAAAPQSAMAAPNVSRSHNEPLNRRTNDWCSALSLLTLPKLQRKSLFTSSLGCALHWTRRRKVRWQNVPLPLLEKKIVKGKLTFELQRVAGSYFHSSADGLSRTVNHLVVCKGDIKFLKLSHGRSATLPLCVSESSEEAMLRSHLLPRASPYRPVTSLWLSVESSNGRDDNSGTLWFID